MEKDLDKIIVTNIIWRKDGMTANQWLETLPADWRSLATEALFECSKKGWPLTEDNILTTAREIDAKRNPKGW